MSTTIDERVLEMRFDNRQFESNVSNTMSTLDKLKQKLNFTGASKGLENVNAAAKNVNMTGLGSAVETVSAKFSALQVIGVTALANITNSAVNAGKRIVSALTIDPVKTGFQEYETQINAVQTILSNTESKGTTIHDVNRALEELNKYADMTIYNFTEMTRNIGTFTAAGVDLDTSTNAIKGIANLAAMSGSTSQQASTAMYQLSQALASGTVKLMDWNSVVNAGMGGQVFQDALKETARVHGVAIDNMIEEQGSFRETLSEGWLTADILTETLSHFTMAAKEGSEQWKEYKKSLMDDGYTEQQAEAILKLSNNATDAATKVKTFTQLWDVLKESAQSGWAQTWKILIGDFEEARDLLSPLADTLTGFINRMSDWRNTILEFALDFKKPWQSISEKLGLSDSGLGKIAKIAKGVGDLTDKLEYYQNIVNRVWRGDYDNGEPRIGLLQKDGYDNRVVQDLVNKGYQYKLTVEDIEKSHEKFGLTMDKTTKSSEKTGEAFEDNTESLVKLSDEQLRNAGLTEEEISLYRALEKEAERAGESIGELAEKMSETDGRTLLIDGFKNIGTGIKTFASTIKNAWVEIFNPPGVGELAIKLYGIINSFNEFTKKLTLVDSKTGEFTETAKKLQKTFEGVFAIIDIVATIAGGGLKIAFNVLKEILAHFDLNVLDVTAAIADAIIGFRDFIDSVIDVGAAVAKIIPYVQDVIKSIKDWIESLKTSENLPADIISGLVNGLRAGIGMVWDAAVALAKSIVDAIKSFLGIHSPSVVMAELGENTVEGYKNGLQTGVDAIVGIVETIVTSIINAFTKIWTFLTSDRETFDWEGTFGTGFLGSAAKVLVTIIDTVKSTLTSFWDFITTGDGTLDWGKLFSAGILFSMVWFLKQIATAINGISEAFGGLGDIFENAGRVLNSFSKVLNGYAWDLKAKAMLKMAAAIGILVLALVVLTEIDDIGKLWNAVGIIAALAIILGILAFAMSKMDGAAASIDKDGAKIDGLKTGLLQIALTVGILGLVVKMIGEMDPNQAKQGFLGLAGMAVGMLVFIAIASRITKNTKDITKVGTMMVKLSVAMGLMIMVIKMIDSLNANEIFGGIIFATAFAIFVRSILAVAKSSGNNVSKVGGMMIKLAIAMGLMIGVVKLAGSLSLGEMAKGTLFAAGFVVFLRTLVSATKIGKKQQIAKLGGLVLSVSFSMTLLVGVCKLVGMLKYGEMIKGAIFMAGFIGLLKLMVSALSIGSDQKMAKVALTIFAMATAIGILAAVSVALSLVDLGSLAKGVAAVGLLSLMVAGMAASLKGANDIKGSLIVMTIAIVALAGAIVALSFIEDTSKLMASAGALSMVMGMFALIAKCSNDINKAAGTMAVMIVAVGALATILWLLSNNVSDADSAIKVATSLGILMTALAVSFKIVSGLKGIGPEAWRILGVMATALAVVAVVLGVLTALDVAPAIESAVGLSVVLIALSTSALILSKINPIAAAGVSAAASFLGLVGVAALILAVVGGLIAKIPKAQKFLDDGIPIIGAIGQALGEFIGGVIGGIVGGAGEALMDSFSTMVDTFGEVVDKLVEISDVGTGIKTEGFDGIGKLLEALAGIALASGGTAIADIFSYMFSGKSSMDKFQADAVAFFNAMKAIGEASAGVTIDEKNLDALVKAGKKLADLQECVEPIGGLASYLNGHTDLATFGTNVAAFINSMKVALDSLWGYQFDAQTLDEIVAAAKELANLQSCLEPIDGLAQLFKGREDLSTFGVDVEKFINSMKIALDSVWGYQFDAQTFDEVIAAATKLAELQHCLDPIDGLAQLLKGREDLSTFGVDVSMFMGSMRTALESLWGVQIDAAALESVITAAKKLAGFQSELEPMGNVITWFTGRTDLGTFGINVGLFADAMGKLKSGMGENGITEAVIASITNAGTAILELEKALPTETWFDGKMSLSEFSGYVTEFATAMASFAATAAGIDSAAVTVAMDTANRIKTLIESLVDLDTSGLQTFTGIGTGGIGADGAAYKVAKAMAKFSDEVSGIDTAKVSSAATTATKIKNLISGLAGLDTSGVEKFKSAVTELGKIDMSVIAKNFSSAADALAKVGSDMLSGMASTVRNGADKVISAIESVIDKALAAANNKSDTFKTTGSTLASKMVKGISDKENSAKTAGKSVAGKAVSGVREKYDSMSSAGSYLVEGFAEGIKDKTWLAEAKARAMANAAERAAREALDINSPSKVFREIGMGIPEGFIQGIGMLSSSIDKSVYEMTDGAITSVGDTISKLATLVESDIDSQPTIRPVLDLSDVRSGAATIGSLFDTNSQVGVMANVGTVSTMMRGYGQNGGSNDIVSAIDKLRKDLGNISGDTYSVGNVTYDDGSNIADAVKTITRVARMERRI